MIMKRNKMNVLATSLFILVSFLFAGCAGQSMTGDMDKGMGSTMEEPMDTMKDQKMEKPMQKMTEQKMGTTMDEMKNDAAKGDMGGRKTETMNPAKEEMMK